MKFSDILIYLYRTINKTGILQYSWVQLIFVSCYFLYKKYLEDPFAKLAKNHPELFHNGHILDIGANIGYTAYVFSKALAASNYKVFAFEPEERNNVILKKVAEKYCFSDKMVIVSSAVGDRTGEIELWRNDSHHADHRILTEEFKQQLNNTSRVQKVALTTIDDFLRERSENKSVAFIKIDVQGYELAVCNGMKETLISNPNCVIVFEYCSAIMTALGFKAEELLKFFQERNFLFYRLHRNGKLSELDINNIETSEYFDILCSRKLLLERF